MSILIYYTTIEANALLVLKEHCSFRVRGKMKYAAALYPLTDQRYLRSLSYLSLSEVKVGDLYYMETLVTNLLQLREKFAKCRISLLC